MAKYPRLTGSRKISQDYNKVNEALDMIEQDVSYLEDGIIDVAKEVTETQQSTAQSVNSLQTQINELVINGDSSAAAAQAAIDAKGHNYQNLKLRLDTEHEQVTAQLAETVKKSDLEIQDILRKMQFGALLYGKIYFPFTVTSDMLPFDLNRDFRDGRVKHTWVLAQFETAVKTIYVDLANGNNTTGDGSSESPYQTIKKALEVAATAVESSILILSRTEVFYRDHFVPASAGTYFNLSNKTISIMPDPASSIDKVILATAERGLAWTAEDNVWKTTRTGTFAVASLTEKDEFGVQKPLTNVSSLALCKTTKESWYTDGSTVYVNTISGSAPSDDKYLIILGASSLMLNLINTTLYTKNVYFYGGRVEDPGLTIKGDTTARYVHNECQFCYSNPHNTNPTNGNGLNIIDIKKVYGFGSVAAYNGRDGFNYHYYTAYNTAPATLKEYIVFEYDCKGYKNGLRSNAGNNNASSAHEGVTVVRVGGYYDETSGPPVADVNGCNVLLIDCYSGKTTLGSGSLERQRTSYHFNNEVAKSNGVVYMVNCSAYGSPHAITTDSYPSTGAVSDIVVYIQTFKSTNLEYQENFKVYAV